VTSAAEVAVASGDLRQFRVATSKVRTTINESRVATKDDLDPWEFSTFPSRFGMMFASSGIQWFPCFDVPGELSYF